MEKFIREQIKDKPVKKKNIAKKLGISALCGLVFGLIASGVLAVFFTIVLKKYPEMLVENTESEMVSEVQLPNTEKVDDEKKASLDLHDYQKIQSEIYSIGIEVNKSIVTVTSVTSDTDWFKKSYDTEGLGCGVIISDERGKILILTEMEAIENAKKIKVTFVNDEVAPASLVGYDGNTGIAVIEVDKSEIDEKTIKYIKVCEIGKSDEVGRGRVVLALGSPLGTNYAIIAGTVTSTVNEITTMDNNYSIFTTDIISNKNGSGILVDTEGKIIGLVMQGHGTVGTDNALSAVKISEFVPVLNLIRKGKKVPYMGMYVTTVTDAISRNRDIPSGVYVKEVGLNCPAMFAGLQSGDVITQINGVDVNTVSAYSKQLLELKPGEIYKVKARRKGNNGYSSITCDIEIGVLH